MTSAINQKEYLKKYLSGGKEKKKKRKEKSIGMGVKIIDDDIDLVNHVNSVEEAEELLGGSEDAPQIVGVIDERPLHLRIDDYRKSDLWKPLGADAQGDTSTNTQNKICISFHMRKRTEYQSKNETSSSPKRKKEGSSTPSRKHDYSSPPRKSSENTPPRRNDDNSPSRSRNEGTSPPRRNVDGSPPRRRNEDTSPQRIRNDDSSPPRKRNHNSSPPRKRINEDTTPPRRNNKDSTPSNRKNEGSSPPRKRHQDSSPTRRNEDTTPPKRRNEDTTPPRRRNEYNSPPRKRYEDNSPPTRRNEGTTPPRRRNEDSSPPRKRHQDNSSPRRRNEDTSPLRRNSENSSISRSNQNSSSPGRRNKDTSPLRRRNEDSSPPRRRNQDSSPPRRKNGDSSPLNKRNENGSSPIRYEVSKLIKQREGSEDLNPPIVKRKKIYYKENSVSIENLKDLSLPRRRKIENPSLLDEKKPDKYIIPQKRSATSNSQLASTSSKTKSNKQGDKAAMTLEGKKAGLQNVQELVKENAAFKNREDKMFENMDEEVSGRNAKAIVRDTKTGKVRNLEKEAEEKREKEKKEAENKEKYMKWGKGLKQVEDQTEKITQELYEMSKPLARYADDEDLERFLKEQEREGDPMLDYIRKKNRKKETESGKPEKPVYQGEFMPNRFGIPPGHRWDGVDRSNGYEKKWFEVQNSRRAQQEDVYKWSTEDM